MKVRNELEQRTDVSDADIGDIIEIAQRLQREAEAEAQSLSVEELGEIAEDLDIQAEYVEQAIELRKNERAREAAEARHDAAIKRRVLMVGGVSAALLLVLALLLASAGSSSLSDTHTQVQKAQSRLDQVLQRFALSAAQGVALIGIDASSLEDRINEVHSAADTDGRLAAARQLNQAVAALIAAQAPSEESSQQRLNLHYELTGFQNRIATESERLRAAEAKHESARASLTGKLARLFGMGP